MSKKMVVAAALILIAATAFAAPPQAIALHARRLLDVRSGTVSDRYIVVRGERIEAARRRGRTC